MSDEIELAKHGASGLGGAGVMMALQMLWQKIQKAEEQNVKQRLESLDKGQHEILEKLAVLSDREQRLIDDRREVAQLRVDRETISVRVATLEARIQALFSPPAPRESRP